MSVNDANHAASPGSSASFKNTTHISHQVITYIYQISSRILLGIALVSHEVAKAYHPSPRSTLCYHHGVQELEDVLALMSPT